LARSRSFNGNGHMVNKKKLAIDAIDDVIITAKELRRAWGLNTDKFNRMCRELNKQYVRGQVDKEKTLKEKK